MGAVVKLKVRQASKTGQLLRRPANAALRSREYLTPAEIERLVTAARKRGRYGARDAIMRGGSAFLNSDPGKLGGELRVGVCFCL